MKVNDKEIGVFFAPNLVYESKSPQRIWNSLTPLFPTDEFYVRQSILNIEIEIQIRERRAGLLAGKAD